QAGCTWNAVSDSSWITVTSGASGAGNGSVAYSVAANSGAARTGTIVVAGVRSYTVTQAGAGAYADLAGWWKLDESSGASVADASGLGNHGSVTGGAPVWTAGAIGGALSFDGAIQVNGQGEGAAFPRGGAERTIAAWVKMEPLSPVTFPSDYSIFHYGDTSAAGNFHLYISANGQPGLGHGDRYGTVLGSSNLRDSYWHHIAGVYEGPSTNIARIYVDGIQQVAGALSTPPATGSAQGWRLGAFLLGSGRITALIDDVRLYGRALDVAAVRELAATANPPKPCSYLITPRTINFAAAGGTQVVNIETAVGCAWSAAAQSAWISFAGPASGSGPGSVTVAVPPNPGASARSGSITIADTPVSITQDWTIASCSYSLRGSAPTYPPAGIEDGVISVTTSPAGCPWTATTSESWIKIVRSNSVGEPAPTYAPPFIGTGDGGLVFSLTPNATAAVRNGIIRVQNVSYTVTQDPLDCTLTLDRQEDLGLQSEGGEVRSVYVTPSNNACSWRVFNTSPAMLSIDQTSGTGGRFISYTTKPNSGGPATGQIWFCSIGTPHYDSGCQTGYERNFVVRQDPNCTFTLPQDRLDDVPYTGGSGTAAVRASYDSCSVAAVSKAPWIKIAQPNPPLSSGAATLNFTVDENLESVTRTGTIAIGKQGLPFVVTQQPAPCRFHFLYDVLDLSAGANQGGIDVIASGPACAWTARLGESVDWLTITGDGTGVGNGIIRFSVAANTGTRGRSAAIVVGAASFVIRQDADCRYEISPASSEVPISGGSYSFVITPTPPACAVSFNPESSWIKITSFSAPASGAVTVGYRVDANPGASRAARILVSSGVGLAVSQSGTVTEPAGDNLIVNGDAEKGEATPGCLGSATIPGWTTDGIVSVCAYGPTTIAIGAPGPANRGKNYFAGAAGPSSVLSQTIDLTGSATQIDTGSQAFTLSGWLGGYEVQDDAAKVTATFLGAGGNSLGSAWIGPVLAADRNSTTSLILKSASGTVPSGTRSVRIELLFTRAQGSYNDGYADNHSLILPR
ncbi:MAG: hypothetical protein HY821_23315, partial [Acidobacteria bacterium]|nr:hypothetical protein [Acidobacteriota bacterium]